MENNNNGRGIFYGVIGVATLVVAIIGATFAYFSATAVSNNAINLGTTTVNLSMTNEKRQFRSDMIPVDSSNARFNLYPGLINETPEKLENTTETTGVGTCTDNDGNAICGIYEFTITNPSPTVAQTVYGSIKVTSNSGLENMKYAVFKGSAAQVEASANKFKVDGVAGKKVTEAQVGEVVIAAKTFEDVDVKDDWATNTAQTLAGGTGQTYTVLVWLEEAQAANVAEAGKLLTAEVTFDTGTSTGITGNLSAAT